MKRYELLKQLARLVTAEDLVVTSIGGVKPEWYSLMSPIHWRRDKNQSSRDGLAP